MFFTVLAGLIGAGLGTNLIPATDFADLLVKSAQLSLVAAVAGLVKDLATVTTRIAGAADGKSLVLTVVNFDGAPVTAKLTFDGFDLTGITNVITETLSGHFLPDQNTAEKPQAIVPVIERRPFAMKSSAGEWTFPGFSFTLLHVCN